MRKKLKNILFICLSLGLWNCNQIKTEIHEAPVNFAITELEKVLSESTFNSKIILDYDTLLPEQSFSIKQINGKISVKGADRRGLMYGTLELAEMIQLHDDLDTVDVLQTPTVLNRGLKLNIPLDSRCPSYDDTGDAALKNIENMWDKSFWQEYFDLMAKYRYNVLSLWNPNPFQVMTKLPDYPDLALDDVCVTQAIPVAERGIWDDAGGVNSTVTDQLKVVKRMSIDEKIAFWQEVFQMAEDHGIDVYFVTWNIYLNGAKDNSYGLTEKVNNPKTKAYYRQAVKTFLETYPTIKGIGVTAGERMEVEKGDVAAVREKWLWETYGLGIMDYKEADPKREITMLHRVWYSSFSTIMKYWGNYPDKFDVGYKYVKARLYSSPKESPFVGQLKKSLNQQKLKCWWNLRNDDIFTYRWGDPAYVREFIKNLPQDVTAGYYMGADGYVFGRVFSDKNPKINGTSELEKHWMSFMLWGRLGYDNDMPEERILQMVKQRYQVASPMWLLGAWASASKVVPLINQYMFHSGDRHWSPEMCASRESFKYTPYFRIAKPMPGCGVLSPYQYAAQKADVADEKITPYEMANLLEKWATNALEDLDKVKESGVELDALKADIRAMAYLGKYYSCKISAAALLEEIALEGEDKNRERFIDHQMRSATKFWTKYAEISDDRYYPQMYARVDSMDWFSLLKDVKKDEELIRGRHTKYTLETLYQKKTENFGVFYPYKGDRRWVLLKNVEPSDIKIYIFDRRNELVNYYEHPYSGVEKYAVWEDLAWLPKGKYTIVLEIDNKTATNRFVVN